MKFKDIRKGMIVEDRWFQEWGLGKVVKKLKTVVHIDFANEGIIVFDASHCQFLDKV